jgi:hypothetical protein
MSKWTIWTMQFSLLWSRLNCKKTKNNRSSNKIVKIPIIHFNFILTIILFFSIGKRSIQEFFLLILCFCLCWRNNQLQRHVGLKLCRGSSPSGQPGQIRPKYKTIRYLQKDTYPEYNKINFYPIKYGIRYLIIWHQLKR